MASTISAGTTSGTALNIQSDTSGNLAFKTGASNVTAMTLDSNQNVAFANGVSFTTAIGVASGGTGATTLTANNVVIGNGTSAVQFVAPGTSGNVLTSNGTNWTSAAAAAVTSIANGTSNVVVVSSGGNVTIATNGTQRVLADTSGNVGVRSSGGTTPTYDYNTLGEGLWSRYWDSSGTRTADIVAIGNTPAGATQIMRFLTNTGGSPGTAVERGRFDASGNFQFNSGYGSVATAYGCRAWVNFRGSDGSIRGSGGISSVTRNSTGNYTANFTTAMPDSAFSVVGSTNRNDSATDSVGFGYYSQTTSAVGFTTSGPVGSYVDATTCSLAIFR